MEDSRGSWQFGGDFWDRLGFWGFLGSFVIFLVILGLLTELFGIFLDFLRYLGFLGIVWDFTGTNGFKMDFYATIE